MTHTDYEEAICDNPGTFYFPQTASDCGWILPIHLLDCLFALRAAHVPAAGQFPPRNVLHTSILFSWDMHLFGARVDLQTNIHLHLLQRLGRAHVANPAHLGRRRDRAAPRPIHLLRLMELEGLQRHVWKHVPLRILERHWDVTLFVH